MKNANSSDNVYNVYNYMYTFVLTEKQLPIRRLGGQQIAIVLS